MGIHSRPFPQSHISEGLKDEVKEGYEPSEGFRV